MLTTDIESFIYPNQINKKNIKSKHLHSYPPDAIQAPFCWVGCYYAKSHKTSPNAHISPRTFSHEPIPQTECTSQCVSYGSSLRRLLQSFTILSWSVLTPSKILCPCCPFGLSWKTLLGYYCWLMGTAGHYLTGWCSFYSFASSTDFLSRPACFSAMTYPLCCSSHSDPSLANLYAPRLDSYCPALTCTCPGCNFICWEIWKDWRA